MVGEHRWQVVLLPGGILAAGPAYEALLAQLGDDVDARAKDLEMYAGGTVPPPGYSLETEVAGILRVADDAGFDTFHLVGYSAGGASSLAFASRHPHRLRSLALMEPAWAGRTGQTPEEAEVFDRFRAIPELTPDGMMPAFIRTQLAAGVEPPPPPSGPPPPWMPSRLAGIGGFMGRSMPSSLTSTCSGGSIGPSTSPWVAGAIPTSMRGWRSVWRASSRTSRSTCSKTAITSTRRTGWNRRGWLPPFVNSGHEPRLANRAAVDLPPDRRHDPHVEFDSRSMAIAGSGRRRQEGRASPTVVQSAGTVSSLDSQTDSVVRMTLLGVFAWHFQIQTAQGVGLSSKIGWQT